VQLKVLLAPVLLIAVLIGLGAYSVLLLRANQHSLRQLVAGPLRQKDLADNLSQVVWSTHSGLYRLTATAANETDEKKLQKMADETLTALSGLEQKTEMLVARHAGDTSSNEMLTRLSQEVGRYVERARGAVDMATSDAGSALMLMRQVEKSFSATNAIMDKISGNAEAERTDRIAQILSRQQRQITTLLLGTFGSAMVGLLISVLIGRAIATPVKKIAGILKRIASGELELVVPGMTLQDEIGTIAHAVDELKGGLVERRRLEGEAVEMHRRNEEKLRSTEDAFTAAGRSRAEVMSALEVALGRLATGDVRARLELDVAAEFAKLKADYNTTVDELRELIGAVAETTGDIKSGTDDITRAADDIARRTEQQAASLEETAAALDQISATVSKTASATEQARSVVSAAKSDAEQGGDIVRKAIEAMGSIERSSLKVSQIIGVIDEIAFQTNLLALNAGVEAARAGDAGRGFAVVATEVRALAQRSAQAAKEIKALIASASSEVKAGGELVVATGRSLEQIGTLVGEINLAFTEISAGAQEQASGLGEVNSAVNQMDQVTQQNAAMVEETAAASHTLAQQADKLKQLISRFKVAESPDQARLGGRGSRGPKGLSKPSRVRHAATDRSAAA
jgi:methyl-accepting chemotaxis protein